MRSKCYTCRIMILQPPRQKVKHSFQKGTITMTLTRKRILLLLLFLAAGAVLGRLLVRAALNLLVGGTLFGGNFL